MFSVYSDIYVYGCVCVCACVRACVSACYVNAAGHDTTSSAMQWMFYYLAKHPDIQEKCRQEAVTYANADGEACCQQLYSRLAL